jgi:hypothetical protein
VTIKAAFSTAGEPGTRTQATDYYEQLGERFDQQLRAGVPRSNRAWGAEQARLGSWETGVGLLRPPGIGAQYESGVGRQRFNYSPEIEER